MNNAILGETTTITNYVYEPLVILENQKIEIMTASLWEEEERCRREGYFSFRRARVEEWFPSKSFIVRAGVTRIKLNIALLGCPYGGGGFGSDYALSKIYKNGSWRRHSSTTIERGVEGYVIVSYVLPVREGDHIRITLGFPNDSITYFSAEEL